MKSVYLVPSMIALCIAGSADARPKKAIVAKAAVVGVCSAYSPLTLQQLTTDQLEPGQYYFKLKAKTTFDIELVSGGGGGGSASDIHTYHDGIAANPFTGSGGGAGEYGAGTYTFEPGRYFVLVGKGGAGGVSLPLGDKAPDGAAGGDTAVGRCLSGLDLVPRRHGGAKGKGDGNPSKDQGSEGGSLSNPTTGERIGTGGGGGLWQNNGVDGGGWGSGGGGQGGTNKPGRKGGDGGRGFARFTIVG